MRCRRCSTDKVFLKASFVVVMTDVIAHTETHTQSLQLCCELLPVCMLLFVEKKQQRIRENFSVCLCVCSYTVFLCEVLTQLYAHTFIVLTILLALYFIGILYLHSSVFAISLRISKVLHYLFASESYCCTVKCFALGFRIGLKLR